MTLQKLQVGLSASSSPKLQSLLFSLQMIIAIDGDIPVADTGQVHTGTTQEESRFSSLSLVTLGSYD